MHPLHLKVMTWSFLYGAYLGLVFTLVYNADQRRYADAG